MRSLEKVVREYLRERDASVPDYAYRASLLREMERLTKEHPASRAAPDREHEG